MLAEVARLTPPAHPIELSMCQMDQQLLSLTEIFSLDFKNIWNMVLQTRPVRASPAVLSMWPFKNISHIHVELSNLLFCNPLTPHKTKTGTANTWETRYRWQTTRTNCYDWPMRNREQQPNHITYTLRQVLNLAVPFTSLSKVCQIEGWKAFWWAQQAEFYFSPSNLNVQGHILSSTGDKGVVPKSPRRETL
jgi:hypothetical protein